MNSDLLGEKGGRIDIEQTFLSGRAVARRLCYPFRMNPQDALATLRRYESSLRARGVTHAGVFGSVARGEGRPDSDLDIMIDLDPQAHITLFGYVGLKGYIASLFDRPVDVIDREALKPHLRAATARDVVYAF